MAISEIISSLSNMPLSSEQEVRTKVAVPILECLGYSPIFRAEEFPVFMMQGRDQKRKVADILLFTSSEYEQHKSDSLNDREWVQNHSLVVIELKKPSEDIVDSIGQAFSYVMWAKALFYMVTNGKKIAVYKFRLGCADECILSCEINDLVSEWVNIESLISYHILKEEKQGLIAGQDTTSIYDDYCMSRISMDSWTQEWHAEQSFVSGIKLNYIWHEDFRSPKTDFHIGDIMQASKNVLIIAPSGYGKTYCINSAVKQYSLDYLDRHSNKIPITLQSSLWKRSFHSIEEGIYNELHYFIPSISLDTVKSEILSNKFILFIDALDECPLDVDQFIKEINTLASSSNFNIITTSKPSVSRELLESFETYSLNGLSEKQINDITVEILGYNAWILHEVNQNLRVLLHTPLFLSMYLLFLKEEPMGNKKPKNLAAIYNHYIKHLLTTYLIKKGVEGYNNYSIESLKRVLEITAFELINNSEININLDEICLSAIPTTNIADIRRVLYASSIIHQYDGVVNFQFESVKEYFYSLYLARLEECEIITYIDKNASSEKSVDIILLMIGNMANEEYQNRLLDHLEKTNFALYMKCLKTRYSFSNKHMENLNQITCESLFRQVIVSYENIVRTHFVSLIDSFFPWTELDENADKNAISTSIVGTINLETLYVDICLGVIPKESTSNRVKVEYVESNRPVIISGSGDSQFASPIFSFSDNIRNFGYDLKHYYNGIDCARELAAQIVWNRLEKLLEMKNLLFSEHPYMQCQYIEQCLKKLPKQIVSETLKSDKLKLSLNNTSLDELDSIFKPVNNLVYRAGYHSVNEVNFLIVWAIINEVKSSGVNPTFALPPEGNRSVFSGKSSVFIWEYYTLKEIKFWIARYYDAYQASYRYFVDRLFPTLKDDMPLYGSGPVQFQVAIISEDNEDEYCSDDYHVEVIWEPKYSQDECQTVVTLKKISERNKDAYKGFYEKSIKKLRFLGRKGYGSGISHHGIMLYISSPNDNYAIRNRVYKKVSKEIKEIFDA